MTGFGQAIGTEFQLAGITLTLTNPSVPRLHPDGTFAASRGTGPRIGFFNNLTHFHFETFIYGCNSRATQTTRIALIVKRDSCLDHDH